MNTLSSFMMLWEIFRKEWLEFTRDGRVRLLATVVGLLVAVALASALAEHYRTSADRTLGS